MSCIFCDIVSRNSPAEIVYESEDILAFLDTHPLNYGHTLVIPKEHYSDINTLPLSLSVEIFTVFQKISAGLKESLNSEGLNIISNVGKAAGQTVFHCHFHLIPRFKSDGIKFKVHKKVYSSELKKEIGHKIRKVLKN